MKIDAIIQAIKDYDQIIIHRHVRPDPDAYGSQVGLKEMIKASFPQKEVYAVGVEDPSLHFLARMDHVADEQYKEALVIICDTANTDRICDQRYVLGEQIIKIDHHPNHDAYGDLLWVDTSASSTSEMIYELYESGKEAGFKMTPDTARLIYAGIVGDTGGFMFPSTTPKTFKYAADLVTFPFDRSELHEGIYNITEKIARLRGHVLQHFTLSDAGVSTIKLTKEKLQEHQIDALESGKLIAVLGAIEGLKAWAFYIEEAEGVIRVRIRSKGPVINDIAAKYNGGGHPLAAGATVQTWEEAERITKDLEAVCRAYV
ncbi:MAG TPA: bifunctional oligoribonuclease/PAP phosphatase NrnA [Virgibacillus sp.]|nr:bifunctional oligoribonuclease/PAP phosphatase NrnA [Virgibacillus sp.]